MQSLGRTFSISSSALDAKSFDLGPAKPNAPRIKMAQVHNAIPQRFASVFVRSNAIPERVSAIENLLKTHLNENFEYIETEYVIRPNICIL